MDKASYVVVFPAVFARGRTRQLASNIRRILRARGLRFGSVRRDGDVLLVDAADPVFASSAVCLLFGIERVAIARRTGADLGSVTSGIASVGGSLLLGGERFLVKVDGATRGFAPKDAEMAATSEMIGGKHGARPGTEQDHDRVIYAHVTRTAAYVCIFIDEGLGGVPHASQEGRAVCAIHDELSAVSCYETVRQGYDVRIMVCYGRDSELAGLARATGQIIHRLACDTVNIDFYRVPPGGRAARADIILELMLRYGERYVSLALTPLSSPAGMVEAAQRRVFEAGAVPLVPLAGADPGMFRAARELGLDAARLTRPTGGGAPAKKGAADAAAATRKSVSVRPGPNCIHEMLDSLEPGRRARCSR